MHGHFYFGSIAVPNLRELWWLFQSLYVAIRWKAKRLQCQETML